MTHRARVRMLRAAVLPLAVVGALGLFAGWGRADSFNQPRLWHRVPNFRIFHHANPYSAGITVHCLLYDQLVYTAGIYASQDGLPAGWACTYQHR